MYDNNIASPAAYQADATAQSTFITKVFGWMFLGLLLTAIAALLTASTPTLARSITENHGAIMGLCIVELLLVFSLGLAINRLSAGVATLIFLFYATLNGLTLSGIFLIFSLGSIATTFFITSALFGGMALYGYITKRDLTSWGNLLLMCVVGLIVAMLVNMFLQSGMMSLVISAVGVVVFTGLTAYDMQRIKYMYLVGDDGSQEHQKAAIMGALRLYLDFINLFLMLLQFFAQQRER